MMLLRGLKRCNFHYRIFSKRLLRFHIRTKTKTNKAASPSSYMISRMVARLCAWLELYTAAFGDGQIGQRGDITSSGLKTCTKHGTLQSALHPPHYLWQAQCHVL